MDTRSGSDSTNAGNIFQIIIKPRADRGVRIPEGRGENINNGTGRQY